MSFFIHDPVRRVITPLPEDFYRRKITDPEELTATQNVKGALAPHGSPQVIQVKRPSSQSKRQADAYTDASTEETAAIEPVARELMSSPVISSNTNTPISEIWSQFNHHKVHHLGLIDEHGMLAGIVSYENLLEWVMNTPDANLQLPVSEIPQGILITASPDATLSNLALVMLSHQVTAVPVVSSTQTENGINRRLEGIVTNSDILKACMNHRKGINFQA